MVLCHLKVGIGGVSGRECACQCRRNKGLGFDLWFGMIPWRRVWQLQYSCLENTMDRGTCQAMVHRIIESDMTEVT